MPTKQDAKEIKEGLSEVIVAFEAIIESKRKWLDLADKHLKTMKNLEKVFSHNCFSCERGCKILDTIHGSANLVQRFIVI